MAEALMQMYKTMTEEEQKELYDFARFIISRNSERKTNSQANIDKYFGSVDDETTEQMLAAVAECRRIEFNEW